MILYLAESSVMVPVFLLSAVTTVEKPASYAAARCAARQSLPGTASLGGRDGSLEIGNGLAEIPSLVG